MSVNKELGLALSTSNKIHLMPFERFIFIIFTSINQLKTEHLWFYDDYDGQTVFCLLA